MEQYIHYNSIDSTPELIGAHGLLRGEKDARADFIFRNSITNLNAQQKSCWTPLKVKVGQADVKNVFVRIKEIAVRTHKSVGQVEAAKNAGKLEELILESLSTPPPPEKVIETPQLTQMELLSFDSLFAFSVDDDRAAGEVAEHFIALREKENQDLIKAEAWPGRLQNLASLMAQARLGEAGGSVEEELQKMKQTFAEAVVNEGEVKFIKWKNVKPEDKTVANVMSNLREPLSYKRAGYYEAFVTYWLSKDKKAVPEAMVEKINGIDRVAPIKFSMISGGKEEVLELAQKLIDDFMEKQKLNGTDLIEDCGPGISVTALFLSLKVHLDRGVSYQEYTTLLENYNIELSIVDLKTMEKLFLKGINWEIKSNFE